MKILWFYKYIADYDFDNWLHLKFVEVLKQHPGVELLAYGPGISEGYPHLTTLPYDKNITIDDIKKHFNFDAIILNTKSRMFMDYNPHRGIAKDEWLPKGWALIDVPKIVLEEDYHYEKDDEWYKQNRVDLILQRHWSQTQRQATVPMRWFPFSVDTDTFRPHDGDQRTNKICFAGSISSGAYKYRHLACDILKRHKLIDMFPNGAKTGYKYVKCLREYTCHLSCSSIYHLTPAKMFEIMASGSVLLTNENADLPMLFPNGSYYTYKIDGSNVHHVAAAILHDKISRDATVKLALETINTRHSHKVRIEELLNIIRSMQKKNES